MREWRSKTIELFSEAIHPCFLGSILTECPPTAKNAELHAIGILGQASAASEETLNFACKSIWYFTSLGFFLIFNDHDNNPPLIVMDKENKLHQHAVVGRRVIQTMNTRYWDYEIY